MKWLALALSLAFLAVGAVSNAADISKRGNGCCMTDPGHFVDDTPENIRHRFDLYKQMGVDTVRVGIEWRGIDPQEGSSSEKLLRYLKIVKEYGFRVKLIVGVLMGPPGYYLGEHPDAMLTDENGGHSRNTMSFWYPDLRNVVDKETRRVLGVIRRAGLMDSLDSVIPALGPAGEPLYPVPWTLGPGFPKQTYWCYDEHAQADFRATMKRKYKTVEAANNIWGTSFASWDDAKVLKPGEKPGLYWEDMLTWYRDTKRDFIVWAIDDLRKYIDPNTRVLIYIPGTHYSDGEWANAVKTGIGCDNIKAMSDTRFLVDIARKKNCWLQYTGCENDKEVAFIRDYIDQRGYKGIEMWGENAGDAYAAGNPAHLADVVVNYRLCGLDYTHAHFAFENDRVTPNKVYPELEKAYVRIRESVGSGK